MKKIEFLKELEERLVVLNEKERLDILEEYEQHIDMKIAGGMREDEAIEDFGNLKELVDDILDAYRVNLKYNKADPLSKMASGLNSVSSNITKAYNKTMEGSKNLFGKIEGEAKDSNSKIKDLFCKISNKWKKFLERTAERFRQYKEKFGIKRNEQMKEKNDLVTQENGSKENTTPIKDFFNKFKSGMKKIMVWIWKFLLVLVNIPIFCLNAIMIFLFGTSVVLTMKGYGSFGIVVALLGSIILISSFSILLILMCKEIKKFYIWTLLPLGIGILLIGVGVGTSFIQFSSFTYGGTVLVNEDNIICEEFSFTIEEEGPVYIDNDNYLPYKVIGDETLEDNEIIFEINYDTNQYGIEVRNVSNEFYHSESEDLNDNQYLIEREYKNYSDFAYLLKAKDIVLEGIKNKKLYGIECEYWSDVVIRTAPENVDRIKDIREITN